MEANEVRIIAIKNGSEIVHHSVHFYGDAKVEEGIIKNLSDIFNIEGLITDF